MLDELLDRLRCPHCGGSLARAGPVVRCPAGHSFDAARQGYLSLVRGHRRAGGDSAAMVAARERFLTAGHFDPLGAAVAEECERALGAGGCVVDLGAGTGWYLARALDRLPDRAGLALDLSRPALRRAARAHPRAAAVGCDVWGPLPLRDGVAAAVLSVFAPRNGAEIARLLSPDGVLVAVVPDRAHLRELVEPLGLLGVDERKDERLRDRLGTGLELVARRELRWTVQLDHAAARDAAAMGPSAYHVESAALEDRVAALPEPLGVTASVSLSLAIPTTGRSLRRAGAPRPAS